jgi:sodium transport system ATP-binding protein
MIEIKDLTKSFELTKQQRKELATTEKLTTAVKNVSFTCQPGRVFSLLGANGAGKTTILRMLATIYKPTSGSIHVCGIDSSQHPTEIRKKIGFLTGSTAMYARLTPNELIKYFADLYSMESSQFEARKKYLFDLLDVNSFANKRIGKLSTGMKQRVSICRTMIHDPEVVVFDEPTSGLDVISAESIIQLIRDCKNQGKTVIFSSHIMSEIELLCDDLAIIHKGELIFNDTFENFKSQMTKPNITEEFIYRVQTTNV